VPVNALDLVGKEIITSDGRNLGSVSDIAFDVTTWRVRDLRAAIDKRVAEELGLPKRMGGGQFLIKTEQDLRKAFHPRDRKSLELPADRRAAGKVPQAIPGVGNSGRSRRGPRRPPPIGRS